MHTPHDELDVATCARNVSFAYGRTRVFARLSFEADSPIVVLIGPNGSGKTTLLKLFAGILKPAPDGSITRPSPVGIVLQDDSLLPWLSVRRNLRMVGVDSDRCQAAAPLLSALDPLMGQRACDLSFGQRRVVELYRLLATPFRLLCLDEPFNFLDERTAKLVAEVIASLAAAGTRFIVATHYYPEWLQWPRDTFRLDGSLPVHSLQPVDCQ